MRDKAASAKLFAGILLILLPQVVTGQSAWPMFLHDLKHTGRSPYQGPQMNHVTWTYRIGEETSGGGTSSLRDSPVVGPDGTIYVGSYLDGQSKFLAINPDGTLKWSADIYGGTTEGIPAIGSDGAIYFTTSAGVNQNGLLYCLNPDGSLRWTGNDASLTHFYLVQTGLAIDGNGIIYLCDTVGGALKAVNPDGTLKWGFPLGARSWSSPVIAHDGTIYVGQDDHVLFAIDPNGSEKWSIKLSNVASYYAHSPSIGEDGTIYFGDWDRLYAITPSGQIAWSVEFGTDSSPAIGSDGTIYVGGYLDILEGHQRGLAAIEPTGSLKWFFAVNGGVYSSPAIGNDGTIYFGSNEVNPEHADEPGYDDSHVYALNPDGSIKWKYKTGGFVVSSPAITSSGLLVVSSWDGELYAFSGGEPPEPPEPPKFLTLPFRDLDINIVQGWVYTRDPDPNAHKGIDYIKGSIYDLSSSWQSFNIVAAADGVAMHSSSLTYGEFVLIRHNEKDNVGDNYFTLYAHLDSVVSGIPPKDKYDTDYSSWKSIKRGEPIGRAGTTGAPDRGVHLHFEVQRKAYPQYKTDPYDLYTTRDSYPQDEAGCGPNYLWTVDPPERADGIVVEVHSPVELRVFDSQGRITGLLDGEEKNDIPDSAYFENSVTIFSPIDTYYYEVVGTDEGTYGLGITSISEGQVITFQATEIPTSPGARHEYTLDWSALSSAEEGVTLKIDADDDGVFERTVIADEDLTSGEFALQTETVIDFEPDVLNLASRAKFVTVDIKLPKGYDARQIDVSSLRLNDSVAALPRPLPQRGYPRGVMRRLVVRFDRQEVIETLEPGRQIVCLTGRLTDGTPIAGMDTVRVVSPKPRPKPWPRFGWSVPEEDAKDLEQSQRTMHDDVLDTTDMGFDPGEGIAFMLVEACQTISELGPESFNNEDSAIELTNTTDATFTMLDDGLYLEALGVLDNDVLQRIDGCANTGQPDEDDWIRSVEGQALVYPLVVETMELLESLI